MAVSILLTIINIVGFVLTIVGFALTIYQVKQGVAAARRAETAAKAAERAAQNVRTSMVLATTIADCVGALAIMDEIMIHHRRREEWGLLPEKYSKLKRRLVSIRSENTNLLPAQVTEINGAISQFSAMEGQVEKFLVGTSELPQKFAPKWNKIVSGQIDRVYSILTGMQRSIRKQDHGNE